MVEVMRLSSEPCRRDRGAALLEEYFRLPDAWGGRPPAQLPRPHRSLVTGYPGGAVPPDGDVLLAFHCRVVVGQVLIVRHSSEIARLERMYVVERARGHGVGKSLLSYAVELARLLRYDTVVLDVIAERVAALQLYERFGLAPVEPYADYGRPMGFLADGRHPLSPQPRSSASTTIRSGPGSERIRDLRSGAEPDCGSRSRYDRA
jgi:GNAT superfamily N-acetyltransferase